MLTAQEMGTILLLFILSGATIIMAIIERTAAYLIFTAFLLFLVLLIWITNPKFKELSTVPSSGTYSSEAVLQEKEKIEIRREKEKEKEEKRKSKEEERKSKIDGELFLLEEKEPKIEIFKKQILFEIKGDDLFLYLGTKNIDGPVDFISLEEIEKGFKLSEQTTIKRGDLEKAMRDKKIRFRNSAYNIIIKEKLKETFRASEENLHRRVKKYKIDIMEKEKYLEVINSLQKLETITK